MTGVARRSPFWVVVATWYASRSLKRRVEGIYVEGLCLLQEAIARGPVVLVANHGSWWDTFVMLVVSRHVGLRSHALMDERNLHRLAFFARVGALPLTRKNVVHARAQIDDAAMQLRAPMDAIWVFADGAQRPFHARPLVFKRGAAWLAQSAQAAAIPCAISLVWRERREPAYLISFGDRVRCEDAAQATDALAQAVTDLLDAQTHAALSGAMPPCVFVGTRDARDDGLATRMLAWLCRM